MKCTISTIFKGLFVGRHFFSVELGPPCHVTTVREPVSNGAMLPGP